MKVFLREGQVRCWECGEDFVADSDFRDDDYNIPISCPNGCNRSAWARREGDVDYCIETDLEVKTFG